MKKRILLVISTVIVLIASLSVLSLLEGGATVFYDNFSSDNYHRGIEPLSAKVLHKLSAI